MKRIIKNEEPNYWKEFLLKHSQVTYNDLENSIETKNIKLKLKSQMVFEQNFICCYCCRKINNNNSHIEHIKPRDKYYNLSMNYDNLLISCNDNYTCGKHKGNKYSENLFVSPLTNDCEKHFKYQANGFIKGVTEKGKYTIDLLNLNSNNLVNSRKAILCECINMSKIDKDLVKKYYLDIQNENELSPFVDMIKYFFDIGYFDFNDVV